MLRMVLFGIVALLVLSFFGVTLQSIVNSPAGQENFGYVGYLFSGIWDWVLGIVHGGVGFLIRLTSL